MNANISDTGQQLQSLITRTANSGEKEDVTPPPIYDREGKLPPAEAIPPPHAEVYLKERPRARPRREACALLLCTFTRGRLADAGGQSPTILGRWRDAAGR
jgi:hypothetical protein